MIDLCKGARPDERFHVEDGPPLLDSHLDWGWLRRTKWTFRPGVYMPGRFVSWWLFGHLQWYHGSAKVDATRTFMARNGQLGEPRLTEQQYVVTTTPSEMHALRWRSKGPGEPVWTNMGGS